RKPYVVRALVKITLLGLVAVIGLSASAYGQPKDKLPKGPETKVEAEATPGQPPAAPTQPFPGDVPPAPGFVPIFGRGAFASPAADGYRADFSTTGTIVNIPQIDFPGIVTVVPSAVIADQQILRVDDMLRDIPAAVKSFDNGFRPDAFILRGFEVRARDYR